MSILQEQISTHKRESSPVFRRKIRGGVSLSTDRVISLRGAACDVNTIFCGGGGLRRGAGKAIRPSASMRSNILKATIGFKPVQVLASQTGQFGTVFPVFDFDDIARLPNYTIYLKLMIDGTPSRSFSAEH